MAFVALPSPIQHGCRLCASITGVILSMKLNLAFTLMDAVLSVILGLVISDFFADCRVLFVAKFIVSLFSSLRLILHREFPPLACNFLMFNNLSQKMYRVSFH